MLKTFFKIMFSASFRQLWMQRYEKYGAVRKSLIIVLLTLLTGGAIGCCLWSISLYSSNFAMGLITTIIFCGLAVVAFELSVLYSTIAFRFAKTGSVNPYNFKKKNKEEATNEQPASTENAEVQPKKSSKALDYVIGFLGLVYGLGVIISIVLIIYNTIKP